jgi:glycyl-tRNA synthetase beta chain
VRASDGKQECFFLQQHGSAARVSPIDRCDHRRTRIGKAADPQDDGIPAGRRLHTCVSFVRPAHRLIVLHGADVVPGQVLGLRSGRTTFGHRFQSAGELTGARRKCLCAMSSNAKAACCPTSTRGERASEAMLSDQAALLQASMGDETQVEPLLDEVTALVEWPAVYVGRIRSGLPAGAAGMPDPHDAHQSKVLPAVRYARHGCCRAF